MPSFGDSLSVGRSATSLDVMSSGDFNAAGMVAVVIGAYVLLAVGFLRLGVFLQRRYPRAAGSRLSATVHALALFACLIGGLLAWMAYASDNPAKERQLLLPIILPAFVYGFVLMTWLKSYGLSVVVRTLSALFSRARS
jgi:ABC-type sulfate transport system permease component